MSNQSTPEVTQEDRKAAEDMLNHAFRHVGVRALKNVKFRDIAEAFAHHRLASTTSMREALEKIDSFKAIPLIGSEGQKSATLDWNRAREWAAHVASDALASRQPADKARPNESVWESYRLPCDVHLAPATIIKAGCQLATLKIAMEVPHRPKHFDGHPNDAFRSAAPPVEGLTRGEVREGCVGTMTAERAAYFLERFKRDEKMLGPHEQWALDYAIAALAASPKATATASVREDDEEVDRTADEAVDFVFDLLAAKLELAEWQVVEGSEEWEGDVSATLHRLLVDAGIIDDETGAIASLTDSGTAATIGGERA